jgi:hypothetical protein
MKVKVTFKDPDCLWQDNLGSELKYGNPIREEYETKWFDYGEYVTLEIDTDTGTIKVLENK